MVIVKSVDYRCILWGISRNETPNILYNFALEDKGALYMEFIPNKKHLLKWLKKEHLVVLILETFI